MKVLFIAALRDISASGRQRLWALEQCGANVMTIDKDSYHYNIPFLGKLARLLQSPTLLSKTNSLSRNILSTSENFQPDIIWYEWARESNSDLFASLKQIESNPLLISFQDDNPWGERTTDFWMWKKYFEVVRHFDLHLIKRDTDKTNLEKFGAKNFYKWAHGIYTPWFHPSTTLSKQEYPISFVGTCMDNRVELIEYLLDNGVPIHIFGSRWETRSRLPDKYPNNFHKPVVGEAYANVIRNSMMCLGLVSHSNHDEWTMRTYEVPGCAVLLVAEDTPTHRNIFGKDEVVLFSTKEDCLSKIRFQLDNIETTLASGRKGYESLLVRKKKISDTMKEFINTVFNSGTNTK